MPFRMAVQQHRPQKVLNNGPGSKRFVFKNFSQRVEEVDVDVFRSLAPVKFQPTAGSSFFHENLVQWKELNSAADFNDVYQQLLPVVQSLPLLLHNKETVVNCLLSRVHMSAALSLEPILSLIALLSRDLLEEFLPFIPRFLDACTGVLKEGADRDPDLLEQVFTSISYVIKYLNKLLIKDIPFAFKVTKGLRYYPKAYVQEFAAEAISFLLRNASTKQLIKGVRKIIAEAEADPTEAKISGCAALFCYTLKGPSYGLHSRAEPLLRLLLDRSLLLGVTKRSTDGRNSTALKVVTETLQRISEDVHREKLKLLWTCLLEEINRELDEVSGSSIQLLLHDSSIEDIRHKDETALGVDKSSQDGADEAAPQLGSAPFQVEWQLHLSACLSLLNGVLEHRKGSRVSDYKPLFSLANRLLQPQILFVEKEIVRVDLTEIPALGLCSEVLRLLLALVKSHGRQAGASFGPATIAKTAPTWAVAFSCQKAACLVPFLRGIVEQDYDLVRPFVPYLLRAFCHLIKSNSVEVLPLVLDLCTKMDPSARQPFLLKAAPESNELITFVVDYILMATRELTKFSTEEDKGTGNDADLLNIEPSTVWVSVHCFPYVVTSEGDNSERAWEFILAVEDYLTAYDKGEVEGAKATSQDVKKLWQTLMGAGLSAHTKVLQRIPSLQMLKKCASTFLGYVTRHMESAPILRAVADYLDASFGIISADDQPREYPTELNSTAGVKFLTALQTNLGSPEKSLRLATLRILSHFEPLSNGAQESAQSHPKRQKHSDGRPHVKGLENPSQLVQQLLSIESTQLDLENSRKINSIISHIKVDVSAGRTPSSYIIPLVHAMIGVLRNRFSALWDPVMDCLAALVESQGVIAWDVLTTYLQKFQELFLLQPVVDSISKDDTLQDTSAVTEDALARLNLQLAEKTESTDNATLLTLLLRTIQKLPKFAEAKSRQLLPLFLAFVGRTEEGNSELSEVVKGGSGKYWKVALKEWLTLLKEMRNARAFYKGPIVKDILLNRTLMDNDPSIQKLTLECLLNWKDSYLTSYVEHLENLISYLTLREELATWSVTKENHQVQEEHRPGLIAVILRILYPKIMKRSGKFAGKAGAGVQRNSVLSFLAQLETEELAPLFCLLLKPLQAAFLGSESLPSVDSVTEWETAITEGKVSSKFIDWIDCRAVVTLPYKRKMGFLHMVRDSLDIFDRERLEPYLHALLGVVFKCLESTTGSGSKEPEEDIEKAGSIGRDKVESMDSDPPEFAEREASAAIISISMDIDLATVVTDVQPSSSVTQIDDSTEVLINGKDKEEPMATKGAVEDDSTDIEKPLKARSSGNHDLRTLCLKVIATVMTKMEDLDFNPIYWDILFKAISPSIPKFAVENHLSSAPGAVFSCLVAMGRSVELAPLLARDPALVPSVVGVLGMKAASPAVIAAVISFVEGLLNLEVEEGDEGKKVVMTVLLPHLHVLLSRIHDLLINRREKTTGKRSAFSVKRELRIITRLSQYIKDGKEAAKLVDVLLPFLKAKKRMDQEAILEVLHILTGLAPALDTHSFNKCLPALAPLLATVSVHGVRVAICQTLQELGHVEESLLSVANQLADLNAMSTLTIEEFDYNRRLQAYERMDTPFFSHLNRPMALLILSHVVYDMGSEDMSLRHSSSSCLQSFVRFASSLPEEECPEDLRGVNQVCVVESEVATGDALDETVEEGLDVLEEHPKAEAGSVKLLVQRFLLPHVRNGMASELLVVRREWVALLREMALHFTTIPALNEYQCLLNSDPEVDFFNNVVHLQIHRRIKAMTKFRTLCSSGHFSQGALLRIFVPLFMNPIFEATGDKEGNLVGAAVETIACIAKQLQWEPYFGLLMRSFRFLSTKVEHQKALIRLVCATLDAFHFFEAPTSVGVEEGGESSNVAMDTAEDDATNLTSVDDSTRAVPADIETLLRKRVLPEFTKLMVSKMDIVNASVALALVKILKLMPEEVVEVELPRIVQSITNLLKNRNSQAVRDEARAALVSVAGTLGPCYLHFIVGVLKASLTKGFEVHVLGYTINSIIVKLIETVKVGDIDYCLVQLLEVLENDIMGEVAEEKNVEAIAGKMKETKHMRSFESMRLISQVITFPTQIPAMLGPIRRNLPKSLVPKNRVKVEMMLKQIGLGLQVNPSVTQENLFVLVHALVEDGLKEENAVALALAAKNQSKIDGTGNSRLSLKVTGKAPELNRSKGNDESLKDVRGLTANAHLLTEFAFQLFYTHMKKVKISFQDQQTLSMLDPLVGLFSKCLTSKYDGVLSGVMRCLSILVRLPLPSIDTNGDEMSTLVFTMAQRSGKTDTAVMQACFQLLVILIRHCKTANISEDQLRLLLQFPVFADLEGTSGNTAIALLKAVVTRKLLVPELYDMMTQVSKLMIQSQMPPVRQACSQVFLQFLLDYPLGPKRLQQHLDFLLTNLGYEHASGREAALEMLHTVILKFPDSVVEEQAEPLFLPLVTRLVNDNASHVRAMVGTVLKVLMGRVSSRALQRMLDFSLTWYKGEQHRLWRPAAQVLGFLSEVMKGTFKKHVEEVLEATTRILKQSNLLEHEEDEDNIADWQEVYASLIVTEKLMQQFPQSCLQTNLEELWKLVCSYLLHQHSWIRKACGRLLSMYYKACGQTGVATSKQGVSQLLLHPSWLLLVAGSLCEQLDTENVDSALAEEAGKNLLYVSCLLPSLTERAFRTSYTEGSNNTQSQERVQKALEMLGASRKSKKEESRLDSEIDLQEDESLATSENVEDHGSQGPKCWSLLLVFRKLEKVALHVQPTQTKSVLQWFAAMATRLGADGVKPFLQCMLVPLYKITEGSAAKLVPEDLKAFGDEVLSQLRELIGVNEFVQVYNTVRQQVKDQREKRKRAQMLNVLVDPERNAKRKIRLNLKRQAQKKRKIVQNKRSRGL